jgi:DNA modification methylase
MLEEGDKAPNFNVKTDGGGEISLTKLKGKIAVVYFYPKDDTPGCTSEAIAFSGFKTEFDKCGAVLIGVSKDSVQRHDNFKKKYDPQDHRIPDSVIRIMRHKGKIGQDIDHPAVFPVDLPVHIMEAFTDVGGIVFEPFGGSGTSLLAGQRTGRKVRAVEIAPEYVDVAIKRFQQNHSGVPVTLLASGQTFDAVATERLGAQA